MENKEPNKIQVKVHPDVQTENNVPDVLPKQTFIIGHRSSVFIDGRYVFRYKISMLIRKDGETDPTYTYSRYMRFGFLPPETKEDFYSVAYHCYQSAVIEFNKSLDVVFGENRFIDARFEKFETIKKKIDASLNPQIN